MPPTRPAPRPPARAADSTASPRTRPAAGPGPVTGHAPERLEAPYLSDYLWRPARRPTGPLEVADPGHGPPRRLGSLLILAAVLAAVLVGCQITKQPDRSAGPTRGAPSTAPPRLPATAAELAPVVRGRVFAARTTKVNIVVETPEANTTRQELSGTISLGPDRAITGTGDAEVERSDGRRVDARLIITPDAIYTAPPGFLMPNGRTWARIDDGDPHAGIAYAARRARDVLYFGATSWDLLRFAKDRQRPRVDERDGATVTMMEGTIEMPTALRRMDARIRDDVVAFAGAGTRRVTWEVILDRELLPREYVITADSPELGPVRAHVRFSDWRTQVSAAAPPSDEVARYEQLSARLRG